MGDRPRSICVIPARSGSKTIKDKNLSALRLKTLVCIAAEKAIKSKLFSKVVISTDYPKHRLGIEELHGNILTQLIYHKRPAALCTDDALMNDVVADVVGMHGGGCPLIWLLQVTCPFTTIDDMKQVDKIFKDQEEVNSLITFKEVKEHSNRTYSIREKIGFMEAYKLRYTSFKNKQDLFSQYIRSGNIYVVRKKEFNKSKTLECKPVAAFIVPRHIGINIDDQEDFVLAKYFLSIGTVKGV